MEALGSDFRRLLRYIEDEPPIHKILAAFFHRACPGARLAMDRHREEKQLLEILDFFRKSPPLTKGWQIVDGDSSSSSRPGFSSSSSCSSGSSSSSISTQEKPKAKKLPMIVSPSLDSKDQDPAKVFLDASLDQQQHHNSPSSSSGSNDRHHLVTVLDELIGVVAHQEDLLNKMMASNLNDSQTLRKAVLADRRSVLDDDRLNLKDVPAAAAAAAAGAADNAMMITDDLEKRITALETRSLEEQTRGLVLRRGFTAFLQATLLCVTFVMFFSRIMENSGFTPT